MDNNLWMDADRYYLSHQRDEYIEELEYALDEARGSLESALESIEEYPQFIDLRSYILIALDEVRDLEKELKNG